MTPCFCQSSNSGTLYYMTTILREEAWSSGPLCIYHVINISSLLNVLFFSNSIIITVLFFPLGHCKPTYILITKSRLEHWEQKVYLSHFIIQNGTASHVAGVSLAFFFFSWFCCLQNVYWFLFFMQRFSFNIVY